MANDNRHEVQHESNSRAGGGPDANDPAYKQLESQRRALHAQGESQATAETEDPHRAVADRTGTAMRAAAAAGGAPDPNAREDADRAYQNSRGNHEPRDRPTERS